MPWTPLAERFSSLPLILAGPILRRTEPRAVTVWLALKVPQRVTLRIYRSDEVGELVQQFEGTCHTVRIGDHLHIVAVTARVTDEQERLAWGQLYYYNLFFQSDGQDTSAKTSAPETASHLGTPGILNIDPSVADALHCLVYAEHPLPSFVLPAGDVNQLRIMHGSCRKPHGIGKDMLPALDTVLETSTSSRTNRPQQLFLTGDQIYADDVSGSLLFALIDAGHFLLAGNAEEVLPLVNAPAHVLGPGERSGVVRNKTMFTTSTPQNHLLSLAEYAAMYLFAWSDVLWPNELPSAEEIWQAYPLARPKPEDLEKFETQYNDNRERLEEFRSTLLQVRRALANIATYTICDDHEVTDDWYLDGLWCHHVLASLLGQRVIRNALLTYALFQAWGNTPEQFAQKNAQDFFQALDAWRGDEDDYRTKIIEEIIGMPTSFDGKGELQRSEQALHWHYTYSGPRYQVIVMDTRTQRLYRSPGEFPGLLSPKAMHAQITSVVQENVDVTIIVSATPVLGVDFVESIQFWSRWRIQDNYTYDCEAWALEWGTFQNFLKMLSALQRVVFLSGDVHYAFGSSLEYWNAHTKATAIFVNYTSSPLHNEDSGSHIAVLASVYPWLIHLLRREETPTLDFFAWDINADNMRILKAVLTLIRKRLYLFWWSIPRLIAARRSPYEIILPAHGWLKGAFKAFPPDRIYRLHYLRNTRARTLPIKRISPRTRFFTGIIRLIRPALGGITLLEASIDRLRRILLHKTRKVEQTQLALVQPVRSLTHGAIHGTNVIERKLEKRRNRLVAAILHNVGRMHRWKAGQMIVGYNNIGEISFQWTAGCKEVTQRLWWCPEDSEEPLQTTEYHYTLELPAPEAAPPLP